MSDFPKFVEFREEGPREGFQIEKNFVPTARKIEFINALSKTGLKTIQIVSFVNPKLVPNMADAEQVVAGIDLQPGVEYTGLWLNQKGFERAQATGRLAMKGNLNLCASETFLKRNQNRTSEQQIAELHGTIERYKSHGMAIEMGGISAAFGCNFEGPISQERILDDFRFILALCEEEQIPVPILVVADTMGWGNPEAVKRMIGALRELAPDARIGMHIHDTRGLGIANLHAALSMGVDMFESSVAGLGGCPFAGHGHARAAGNVCTEDAVFLCHELGIETGIDLDKLIAAALKAEEIIEAPLMGRVMHTGGLDKYRKTS